MWPGARRGSIIGACDSLRPDQHLGSPSSEHGSQEIEQESHSRARSLRRCEGTVRLRRAKEAEGGGGCKFPMRNLKRGAALSWAQGGALFGAYENTRARGAAGSVGPWLLKEIQEMKIISKGV